MEAARICRPMSGGTYEKVVDCLDRVQRYGICRFSISAAIDYAVYLYEKGVITRKDTDGLDLKRDYETTLLLIDQVAFRRGLGEVLGKGLKGLADAFGTNPHEDQFETKGTAVTTTADPRLTGFDTIHFEHIVNPRVIIPSAGLLPTAVSILINL